MMTFAIPCHNGAAHLPDLLRSLLAQVDVDCELLLVDDASSDDSVAVARAVAGRRLALVVNPTPLGIPGNWNRCIELVGSDFFCLAHQDDVYAPEFAVTMLDALAQAPHAAAAHCRLRAIDARGAPRTSLRERYKERFWRTLPALESPAQGFQRLFAGNFVGCPSLVFRRAAVAAIGAFDTHFRFVADWEWLLRAHAKDWQLAAVPQALVAYRRHAGQATHGDAASLRRYQEEQTLLLQAHVVGVGADLLPAHTRSTAMRDNLLLDAFLDLQARRPHDARAKLDLLGNLDPSARRSLPAKAVAAAARLGWPGRQALGCALAGYVAWAGR
jgi:GT2 family glycosyltransferase